MRHLTIALLLSLLLNNGALADPSSGAESVSAELALKRLREGNARFVAGKSKHPHEKPDWRLTLETGQQEVRHSSGLQRLTGHT